MASNAWDAQHPPEPSLLAECVHCGFCLPTCPTYQLWGEEMDSPRGRIALMAAGHDGEPLDDTMVAHFDRCLGCMACVTACPSGVQYDRLIESTRAQVERRYARRWRERAMRAAVFGLFPYPKRLRALRPFTRFAPKALRRLAPPTAASESVAAITPAVGTKRARVGMLLGCVQREFFGDVNAATVRVLAADGCEVVAPRTQGCCGALSLHMGREREAIAFAKRLIATFESLAVDAIVVNAAGCGSSMKEYGWVLRDEPGWAERAASFSAKVRDVSEWLVELGPVATRHPVAMTVAYHDACHLAHAQGIRSQPRELLRGIPDLTVRELADADICCGSAGVYNLLQPDAARELGTRKAANVTATGADLVVTANPGCSLQIAAALRERGAAMQVLHLVQLLDRSIRREETATTT